MAACTTVWVRGVEGLMGRLRPCRLLWGGVVGAWRRGGGRIWGIVEEGGPVWLDARDSLRNAGKQRPRNVSIASETADRPPQAHIDEAIINSLGTEWRTKPRGARHSVVCQSQRTLREQML